MWYASFTLYKDNYTELWGSKGQNRKTNFKVLLVLVMKDRTGSDRGDGVSWFNWGNFWGNCLLMTWMYRKGSCKQCLIFDNYISNHAVCIISYLLLRMANHFKASLVLSFCRSGIWEWFCWDVLALVSPGGAVRCQLGLCHLKAWPGLHEPLQGGSCSAGNFSKWACPLSCLSILTTWQLASPTARLAANHRSRHNVCYDLALKVMLHHYP
jgi:hypothetical protein